MYINLYNESKCSSYISIDGKQFTEIKPHGRCRLEISDGDSHSFRVTMNKPSYIKHFVFCTYVVNVEYVFSNVKENQEFVISHEKVSVASDFHLERLIVTGEEAICTGQDFEIANPEKIIKKQNDIKFFGLYLLVPLLNMINAIPAYFLLALLVGAIKNWIWGGISFGCMIALHYILYIVCIRILRRIDRVYFNVRETGELLEQFSSKDYLKMYYSVPYRKYYN